MSRPVTNPRILFVRNLPYTITAEEMFAVFGKYGALRQIRVGSSPDTRGTAFIVYEDAADARVACANLSGFSVSGRYLVVHFHAPPRESARAAAPVDLAAEKAAVAALRARVAAGGVAAPSGAVSDEDALDEVDVRRHARR
jgi:pre-mRNA branch site protein p14